MPARTPWWRRRAVGISVVVAGITAFVGNLSKLGGFGKSVLEWGSIPFVTDTVVAGMVGGLYPASETARIATLTRLATILERKRGLIPLARPRLVDFVRDQTRWQAANDRCADAKTTRPDIARALDIILTRREPPRRLFFLKPRNDWPAVPLRLDSTNLHGVAHDDADLRNFRFVDACLRGASLSGARLDSAVLTGAWLDSAKLVGADLRHARLELALGSDALFAKARLEGASLNGANLTHASFRAARLACATLQGTHLDSAVFSAARVQWAFFDRASLAGVPDWEQIDAWTGAFVRTAILDSSRKAWSYRHGADTALASAVDWTIEKERQWAPDSLCWRSAREP